MHAGADRLEFAPPTTPGMLRALILALLVHALLLAGLAWSVRWKHDTQVLSAEAELWSAVPQEAAPRLITAPPEPPPPPPPPAPRPRPTPAVVPEAPPPPKVDIALQQEKQRRQKELDRQEEINAEKLKQKRDKERREKLEADKLEKARLDQLKQDKLKQDKLKQDKLKQDKQKQDKLKQDKLKAEQASKTAQDQKQAALEAKQLEAQRQKNLQRMAGLAGASGDANAKGSALKSSGPSASYGGRIRARIKPNIVFTDEIVGNPTAEVEVRAAPDGTIVGRKIVKSSGNKAWDDAVIRAIDKTEVLPRDIDGSMPSSLLLVFRPRD